MRRLLLLCTEFPPGPGGIGAHACALARGLAARGWSVTVITPQDYAAEDEITRFNAGLPFRLIRLRPIPGPPLEAIYRWWVARRVAQRFRPDLIAASGERAAWIAARLHRFAPLVAVGHGSEFGLRRFWECWLTRHTFERADQVVCVSEYTRDFMLRQGIRPRAVCVIPNGADDSQFRPLDDPEVQAMRARYGRILLTVGSVTERKGHAVVIRALPAVLRQFPDTHYLIAGLPLLRNSLMRLAADLGVAERVQFLSRVDAAQLVALYNACDLFVMTSLLTEGGDFEGYGIAPIEAALCGKAAVVSGDSGLSEAIRDGETGLIVPQNDPDSTAAAICTLLGGDARREHMGRQARARALAEQTWDRRVAAYHELFAGMVAR